MFINIHYYIVLYTSSDVFFSRKRLLRRVLKQKRFRLHGTPALALALFLQAIRLETPGMNCLVVEPPTIGW